MDSQTDKPKTSITNSADIKIQNDNNNNNHTSNIDPNTDTNNSTNNNNAMYKNDIQRSITDCINNYFTLSDIQFSLKLGDLDQPWFHKSATRESAIEMLTGQPVGTFIIRPSSRGCYAMSWVSETNEIKHNLIYNHYPGYSLSPPNSTMVEKKYDTLTQLVENTEFLKCHVPSRVRPRRDVTKSSTELILRLFEKLQNNDSTLKSLNWELSVLEGPDTYSQPDKCEHRTFIRYCDEEYVAPFLVKLENEIAQELFKTVEVNNTLLTLVVRGFDGFMHINFIPNLHDAEMKILCSSLRWNTTLTHLDLSCNKITDDGAKALAEVIRENRSLALKTIIFRFNFIRQEGLRALASCLLHNKTIDYLDVGNQLIKGSFSSTISLSAIPFEKTLVSLIDNSLHRKRELLYSAKWCPSFHRWLWLSEVQRFLVNAPVGSFLFFLNPNVPNVIFLAYSTATEQCHLSNYHQQHCCHDHAICNSYANRHISERHATPKTFSVLHYRPIYRTDYGYSFTRFPQDDNSNPVIPSLFEHCVWYLCGDQQKLAQYKGGFSSEIEARVNGIESLATLWQLQRVPRDNDDPLLSSTNRFYPTLNSIIQRNKTFLKYPIPFSNVEPNHQDSDYYTDVDSEKKASAKMIKPSLTL